MWHLDVGFSLYVTSCIRLVFGSAHAFVNSVSWVQTDVNQVGPYLLLFMYTQ